MTLPMERAESFEKALELAKFGKFNILLICTAGIVMANIYLETTSMNVVLPVSQCDLHWTQKERNLLGAVSYIGIIISSHCWGFVGDTFGRKKVLVPTLLVGFVVSVISSFCNSFTCMFIFRLINGICVSGATSIIFVYIGEFHTQTYRDKSIMFCCFIMSIFCLVAPVLAWAILNRDWSIEISWFSMKYTPWRLFMVICATPGLISGILILFFPESPKYLLAKSQEEECLNILKKIFKCNTNKDKSLYSVSCLKRDLDTSDLDSFGFKSRNAIEVLWNRTKPLFSKEFLKDTTIYCLLQFILHSSNFGMFVFFPDIVNSVEGNSNENSTSKTMCEIYEQKLQGVYGKSEECVPKLELSTYTYYFICETAYFFGYIFLICIIKRVPKNYILAIILTATGGFGILAAAVRNSKASLALYTALLTSGLGMVVIGSAVVESYPTHLRATAMSVTQLFARLGCVVGSNYIGSLLQHHCNMSFYISSGVLVIGGILSLLLPKAAYC